jgi:hypothetical protein
MIRVERVYDSPNSSDGKRILVDRMWPRGLSRKRAAGDLWLRDLAPSNELSSWFGHNNAVALREHLDAWLKRGVAPNDERSASPSDGPRGSDAVGSEGLARGGKGAIH